MRLKSTLLTPTGFGNCLWGAASRRVVRNIFSVAAMIGISTLGPLPMSSVAWAVEDPQSEEPVTSVTISVMGWEFTPIIQNGVIKGIFAQITPEILVEGNLETVWFEQDDNGDWLTSSWAGSGTALNALGWIRGHFADSAIFNASPNLQTQAPGSTFDEETHVSDGNWGAPTAIDAGLLADDPLQLFLGDEPRTPEMFAMLSLNGWSVAPELSELSAHHGGTGGGAEEVDLLQQLLNRLVAKTESYMPEIILKVGEISPSANDLYCWCTRKYERTVCALKWENKGHSLNIGGGRHRVYWEKPCWQHWKNWGEHFWGCSTCTEEGWEPVTPKRYETIGSDEGDPYPAE